MNGLIHARFLLLAGLITLIGVGCTTTQSRCQTGNCATAPCGCNNGCGLAGGIQLPTDPPPSPNVHEMTGGHSNVELYDRCWPQRYANLAHRAVNRAFTPQVQNGHVLEQTVWNEHFEYGTDKLNAGGIAHLQYLSRRRPAPDRTIYVASAMDLPYDSNCPDRYCGARQELDALRVAAVQKFLLGHNCGRCSDFQVLVHDPADPSIAAAPVSTAVNNYYTRFRGGLGTGPAGSTGGAGPTGTAGGQAGVGGAASR